MQIASDLQSSGMMTVFFGPDSKLNFACLVAKRYCIENGIEEADCRVANYLFPHCKVIAGNEEVYRNVICFYTVLIMWQHSVYSIFKINIPVEKSQF